MAQVSLAKTDRPVKQAAQRLAQLAAAERDLPPMRRGPRPLGLHLTGALSSLLSLPIVWPGLKNGSLGMSPAVQEKLKHLVTQLGPGPNPEFARALAVTSIERARAFLGGVKAYHHHPTRRDMRPAPVLWRAGTTALRDYSPSMTNAPVALVIPSLINRFDILDLDRDHSFLRALVSQGARPLVIDWDAPGAEEQGFALADYVAERLIPILDFLDAARTPVNLIGYCMGGNLALALASLRPDAIRTLTLLATPWDFHRPDAEIGPQFLALAAQMEPYLQTLGYLPVDIVQTLFANFQPMHVTTKFTHFATLDPEGIEARHFVLCEDWLNDGVPLTAPVARECLRDWWGENRTGKLEWRSGDTLVDPRSLKMPAYIIAPGKDRIVPPESSRVLAKLLPHASLHEPMTGHVGMIASEKAPQQVWLPLFHWLKQHI